MEKFIPYAKLSKKKKRELDARNRTMWTINPVTRKPANPKAYNRSKARKWRDDSISVPSFYILIILTTADSLHRDLLHNHWPEDWILSGDHLSHYVL